MRKNSIKKHIAITRDLISRMNQEQCAQRIISKECTEAIFLHWRAQSLGFPWLYYGPGKYFSVVKSRPQRISRSCALNLIESQSTHKLSRWSSWRSEASAGCHRKIERARWWYNSIFIICYLSLRRGSREGIDEVESANTKIKFAFLTEAEFSIIQ